MKLTKTTEILILIIIFGLTNQMSFGQSSNVNVTFGQPNPIGDAMSNVQRSLDANRTARANEASLQASNNAVLKDNYSKVTTDYLINSSSNYKYLVIQNVSGYCPKYDKEKIIGVLSRANKYIVNDVSIDYNSRGKELKNEKKIAENLNNNKEVLFFNWDKEPEGDHSRITQISIKNSEGKIVYESKSKNLGYDEILKPLISNYIYTKEQAFEKIQEFKKYLDLGVITKEEYDFKVSELKPILFGDN